MRSHSVLVLAAAALLALLCCSAALTVRAHVGSPRLTNAPNPHVVHGAGWTHSGRAPQGQVVSFLLGLRHPKAAELNAVFEAVSDPQNARYAQYPSDEEVKAMLSPSDETKAALTAWTDAVCSSRPSCVARFEGMDDVLKVSMTAGDMEDFLGGAELHSYERSNGQSGGVVRSALTSLVHLIPAHLRQHVKHTKGLVNWPWIVRSNARGPAGLTAGKKEALRNKVLSPRSSAFGTGLAPDQILEALISVRTQDRSVVVSAPLWCTLSPPTFANVDAANKAYCTSPATGNHTFTSFDVDVFAPSGDMVGSYSTADASVIPPSHVTQGMAFVQIKFALPLNYLGYTLLMSPKFEGASTPAANFPFAVSGTVDITPSFLKSFHNIPSTLYAVRSDSKVGIGSLALGEEDEGFYNRTDILTFWANNALPGVPDTIWQDYSVPVEHLDQSNPDVETQLDIQYSQGLLGPGPAQAKIYRVGANSTTQFDDIMSAVLADPDRASVLSFSYGGPEQFQSSGAAHDSVEWLNTRFQALGAVGVSVMISSGDTGAYFCLEEPCDLTLTCPAFGPSYPGSSPFVTSVGAAVLRAADNKAGECPYARLCSVETGAAITGGGGFSGFQARPSYQAEVVDAWLANVNAPKPTANTFNRTARAYPDVVLFGHSYPVVNLGKTILVDGTSASSPSFAGMIAVYNDLRVAAGVGKFGFLNPLLYQAAKADPRTFYDISEGSNRCLEEGIGCCLDGFTAVAGWDPASGLGAPNFKYLESFFKVSSNGTVSDAFSSQCFGPDSGSDGMSRTTIALVSLGVALALLIGALLVWKCCCSKPTGRRGVEGNYTSKEKTSTSDYHVMGR